MPTTAQTPSREHDRDQASPWITLASMFVGQRLDKWAAVGAYVALNVAVWPAVSVCAASVLIPNPVPLAVAPLIEMLAVLPLVNVTAVVAVVPMRTLPKLTLDGLALNEP